ncbi:uncharacterized protein BXIN_0776 [Babesia sp. Xinjiang]|uniref:uncharacterized protein n=1 Tax=Babesia sp. Xinjiang TaxID=462227 RepID=UPI000A251883|nr:uncharacterized protein BXIN_0776 [Babesia sp. Xinjiang]ORM41337.1 hypothetical protein BXIN_0776 [Babesia sp. Xinjiang]
MRCFSVDIWLGFLKMVSLGIGERIRMLYADSTEPVVSDELLNSLEDLQLEIVRVTSTFTKCGTPGYTVQDIETLILDGCAVVLLTAKNIENKWETVVEIGNTLSDLISFLNINIAKINGLLAPARETHYRDRASGDRAATIDVQQLRDCCKEIIGFMTKTAYGLSIVKIKILEKRHELFQQPGLFKSIPPDVFKRGIHTSEYEQEEIVPMIILSHCMGAYGIREWCIRYVVAKQTPPLAAFQKEIIARRDGQISKLDPSPFFRTAGAVAPEIKDFIALFPQGILEYVYELYTV